MDKKIVNRKYSLKEEIFNSVSHGIGIVFGIIGTILLVNRSFTSGNNLGIWGFLIYGLGFILLFLSSTLYHSVCNIRIKDRLRIFDHLSIFVFIAASYTPIVLLVLKGSSRVFVLVSIWALAIMGVTFKLITSNKIDKFKYLSLSLYILMGWLSVFIAKPIINQLGWGFFSWLLAGGLLYSLGTIFYSIKKIPFHHGIWHVFVLAAAVVHYTGFYLYLT